MLRKCQVCFKKISTKSFSVVPRMFQWSFVLQFCSRMDLIAATRMRPCFFQTVPSLIPYYLFLIPTPCSLSSSTVPIKKCRRDPKPKTGVRHNPSLKVKLSNIYLERVFKFLLHFILHISFVNFFHKNLASTIIELL